MCCWRSSHGDQTWWKHANQSSLEMQISVMKGCRMWYVRMCYSKVVIFKNADIYRFVISGCHRDKGCQGCKFVTFTDAASSYLRMRYLRVVIKGSSQRSDLMKDTSSWYLRIGSSCNLRMCCLKVAIFKDADIHACVI